MGIPDSAFSGNALAHPDHRTGEMEASEEVDCAAVAAGEDVSEGLLVKEALDPITQPIGEGVVGEGARRATRLVRDARSASQARKTGTMVRCYLLPSLLRNADARHWADIFASLMTGHHLSISPL